MHLQVEALVHLKIHADFLDKEVEVEGVIILLADDLAMLVQVIQLEVQEVYLMVVNMVDQVAMEVAIDHRIVRGHQVAVIQEAEIVNIRVVEAMETNMKILLDQVDLHQELHQEMILVQELNHLILKDQGTSRYLIFNSEFVFKIQN